MKQRQAHLFQYETPRAIYLLEVDTMMNELIEALRSVHDPACDIVIAERDHWIEMRSYSDPDEENWVVYHHYIAVLGVLLRRLGRLHGIDWRNV